MEDRHPTSDQLHDLQRVIDQLNRGDASVRGELLNLANQQLERLTREMREQIEAVDDHGSVHEPWESLFDGASSRLYEALHKAVIKDVRHFYQIATLQIRRELIEILNRGGRPGHQGLAELGQMHDDVDSLSSDSREVFELIWYHELSQKEVAELLDCSVSDVRRLWRSARLELHDRFEDRASDAGDTKFAGD